MIVNSHRARDKGLFTVAVVPVPVEDRGGGQL